MKICLDFPHNFEAEPLEELPGTGKIMHYYPGGHTEGGKDGLLVRVRPKEGNDWLGTFALGFNCYRMTDGIYACPNPNEVCVLSGGEGYFVNAFDPKQWLSVPAVPILDVRPILSHNMLVFVNFTEIVAWGADGLLWETVRIALDGIEITLITPDSIVGMRSCYCDGAEGKHKFSVDLQTGRASREGCPLPD